ncbi:Transposase DDE domain-containing protein [Nitrosomonas sp. Nm33]|nr:Transposase DDE domain-containing protein [Nitrosomonas sp. Nm33]
MDQLAHVRMLRELLHHRILKILRQLNSLILVLLNRAIVKFYNYLFNQKMKMHPDKDTLNYDADELCKRIAILTQSIMNFWEGGGWASGDAANLLDRSMLQWQASLAMSLSRWVNASSYGDLILAWASLGALIEGQLKLFLCVYYYDYAKDIDGIRKRGQPIDPDIKIHLAVDDCGLPVEFEITAGEVNDCSVAPHLIAKLPDAEAMVADRGYDSECIREQIVKKGARAVIPTRRNSVKGNADMDWGLYRYRHWVENAFARLKQYRAVATRYQFITHSRRNVCS